MARKIIVETTKLIGPNATTVGLTISVKEVVSKNPKLLEGRDFTVVENRVKQKRLREKPTS